MTRVLFWASIISAINWVLSSYFGSNLSILSPPPFSPSLLALQKTEINIFQLWKVAQRNHQAGTAIVKPPHTIPLWLISFKNKTKQSKTKTPPPSWFDSLLLLALMQFSKTEGSDILGLSGNNMGPSAILPLPTLCNNPQNRGAHKTTLGAVSHSPILLARKYSHPAPPAACAAAGPSRPPAWGEEAILPARSPLPGAGSPPAVGPRAAVRPRATQPRPALPAEGWCQPELCHRYLIGMSDINRELHARVVLWNKLLPHISAT